jgi:hypothetical protein
MNSNEKQAIVNKLRKRFLLTARKSGPDIYYDLLRESADCTHQNIVYYAVQQGLEYNEAKNSLLHRSKFRPVTTNMLFRPNQPKVVEEHGMYSVNVWQKPEISPDPALSAEPWIEHLQDVLGSKDKADYFIDMLAYRFQNPTKRKPHIAFYFYGQEGGSGKTTLLRTLEQVFGKSAVKTTNTVKGLSSGSATELWSRTWLCVDEAHIGKGSAIYDQIKSYTGNDSVESDKKYQGFGRYEVPAQLIMMSNRQPVFIEENDRRFFVSEWLIPSGVDKASYFAKLNDWLDNENGYEAIAGHLQARKITADPHIAPPMTLEKRSAMHLTKDSNVTAVEDFLADSKALLYATDELKEQLDDAYIKTSRLKHIFSEAGLIETGRIRIKGIDGQARYWHKKEYRLRRTGEGNMLDVGDKLIRLEECLSKFDNSL